MNYKINELAKLLNVSTNTVRRYERFGHIKSVRNENNGYRYYNITDINRLMVVKTLRNFGFAHNDIVKMKNYSIVELIEIYHKYIDDLDKSIDNSMNISNRLKDDLAILVSANSKKDNLHIEYNISYAYVLYQSGDKILTEKNRSNIIHKYLYTMPRVHMVYIIRKECMEEEYVPIQIGWALRIDDYKESNIEASEYIESYEHTSVLRTLLKVPSIVNEITKYNKKQLFDILHEPIKYMLEHNLILDGDIMGIRVATVYEENGQMEYVLFNVPITLSTNKEDLGRKYV